jgi:hypothetical protein
MVEHPDGRRQFGGVLGNAFLNRTGAADNLNASTSYCDVSLVLKTVISFASGTPMMSAYADFYSIWSSAIQTAIQCVLASGGPSDEECVLDGHAPEITRLHADLAYREKLEAATPLVGSYRGKPYQTARYTIWNQSASDPTQLDSAYFVPELFAHLCVFSCLRKRTVELAQILQHLRSSSVGVAVTLTERLHAGELHIAQPARGWKQWKRGEASLGEVATAWLPEWMRRPLKLSRA